MYIETIDKEKIMSQTARIRSKDPDLVAEYEEKKNTGQTEYLKNIIREDAVPAPEAPADGAPLAFAFDERQEEAIALANFRPVLIIRDNQIVPEFAGPDVAIWKERLMEKKESYQWKNTCSRKGGS